MAASGCCKTANAHNPHQRPIHSRDGHQHPQRNFRPAGGVLGHDSGGGGNKTPGPALAIITSFVDQLVASAPRHGMRLTQRLLRPGGFPAQPLWRPRSLRFLSTTTQEGSMGKSKSNTRATDAQKSHYSSHIQVPRAAARRFCCAALHLAAASFSAATAAAVCCPPPRTLPPGMRPLSHADPARPMHADPQRRQRHRGALRAAGV
jgi:hypothetical protein